MRLDNEVAVVTGGANGIGRASALRFAEEGADVVVADLQLDAAEVVAEEIRTLGRRALAVELDASSKEGNEALADRAVAEFGRLDVLLTAAGISHSTYHSGDVERDLKRYAGSLDYLDTPALLFCDEEEGDWQRVLDVNLTGTLLAMQAASRRMIEAGTAGRIITIASIAAKMPDAGPLAYTVSKAGVWMLTKKAARMLAPSGIRVNAIGPGYIATNMTAAFDHFGDDRRDQIMANIPLGRVGDPIEIANAALFLASGESSYFTGEILHPDGGYFTE
ncbi:MAG: SDR family NAD(P)-dependent oxidoreductase [Acidimicrobiales bacterium]